MFESGVEGTDGAWYIGGMQCSLVGSGGVL